MIKVYSGSDSFESFVAAVKEAKKLAKEKNAEIKYKNEDEIKTVSDIFNLVDGIGLFNEPEVLILKRIFNKASFEEEFLNHFDELDKNDLIIWIEGKVDTRKKLGKFLKKEKRIISFEEGKPWQTEEWVRNFLKSLSFKLTNDQIVLLVNLSENNKWIIRSELNKVDIYCKNHSKSEVSDSEFEDILGISASGNVWNLMDSIGSKKISAAMEEVEKIMRFNDMSQYIISMINRELQLIFDVKYVKEKGVDSKSLGLHPFVLKKTIEKTRNYSFEEIKKLIDSLMNLDLSIKSGEVNSFIGLKIFIKGLNGNSYF